MSHTEERSARPVLSLVAAIASNRVIGKDKRLPWRLSEDLRHFKQLTLGHSVIMGRKTCESIIETLGRLLPDRDNIVLTRSRAFAAPGCTLVASLGEAIESARGAEAFVIGGAELYRLALPLASRMHLTEIDAEFEGDAWFPEFDAGQWVETARETHLSAQGLRFHFVTRERRLPGAQDT
ncbi:MAG: dihydrofolate reductase [Pseudomonadota bacterium]